jgi:acyl-coenzyme A synthetase/AMP-(fatty) acid ligase
MSPTARDISPRYIRLSGEIADQAVIDSLKAFFPGVPIVHAYASTEAGVGFEVSDGLEGFPISLLGHAEPEVQLRVFDNTLHIQSPRTARCYLGGVGQLLDAAGFVDTGDIVERRGDRLYFIGRRGGVINVGGLKVHPQEVEAVINRHPSVRISLVKGQKNPITGMVVVAEVVPESELTDADATRIRDEILSICHRALERFKVPMRVKFVRNLPITAGGKLERSGTGLTS